ncbi:urease accessory protein UreE [Pseudorhodobacter sp.]|uniref:urease accessory protein UreE n=1 Tax=Pseudorhodobacter sp. TaxID=1934400 RepID=UPI002647A151|nr:urease accessory protein UreE [Pseudorhodobacter sp.]MDN5786296.1 urease accessory protein UreE [Pseudorhodobacter sp.]
MTDLPVVKCLLAQAPDRPSHGRVLLSRQDRSIRLRALTTVQGETFVLDLGQRISLDGQFGFELEDGRVIEIIHAEEPLIEARGDIARLAWHLGTLHLQCQIEADRILIADGRDARALLIKLGATIAEVSETFAPEPHGIHAHVHTAPQASVKPESVTAPVAWPALPRGDPF